MTKTLTEQWQEGKLKEGYYYTLLETDSKMVEINYCWDDGCFQDYCDNMIDEVLAPVPSYDEYQKSQKKLAIATKALEYYTLEDAYVSCYGNPVKPNPMVARIALKEMEGVK